MTLQIRPIEPWQWLFQGLSSAPPSVVAAVLMAGVVALALPILLVRQTAAWRRRRLIVGCGLIVAGLLAWAAIGHAWETSLEMTVGGVWLARLAGVGLVLLYVGPMALVGLTATAYLGSGKPPRRIAVILALRTAAFLLAILAILRPSLAVPRDGEGGAAVFYIVVDASKSMTIQDESDQRRWDVLMQSLHDAGPALDKLQKEQNVHVEFCRFGDKAEPFSPDKPGEPDGKRTRIGAMLHWLAGQNGDKRVRGLAVLSDGRDNDDQDVNPFTEAGRWRRLGPIYTFGFGSKNTPNGQSDVAVAKVVALPTVVRTKGKITVRATIDARGFENHKVDIHLLLDDKEVQINKAETSPNGKKLSFEKVKVLKDLPLPLTTGNKVVMECDAPDRAGEVKVTVKVDPPAGDKNPDDDRRDTIVTVIKGGLNVLLIDKWRREFGVIYDALAGDQRIQVKPLLLGGAPAAGDTAKLFDFNEQKYDVIIIGDVTAAQMRAIQPTVLDQIREQVERGAGFLMIGGYASFGGTPGAGPHGEDVGDWKGTVIEQILPVDLNVRGQVESRLGSGLEMLPTEDGLRLYSHVVGLAAGDANAETAAWTNMQNPLGLQGANRLAPAGGNATILAQSGETDPQTNRPYPLLVSRDYGKGRVLAFAGDTTDHWIHDADSKEKHDRFWRQMVLWLARQDDTNDQLRIEPDVRSIAVGDDLGFTLRLISKNGQEIQGGRYEVEVIGPGDAGEHHAVTATQEGGEDRGVFRPKAAGEYVIHAKGRGKDASGQDVNADATARFFAYEEDVEMAEWAADEDFLKKLADEGRGEYRRGTSLADFLEHLPPAPAKMKPKMDEKPDWNSASWSPFFVLFFVLFTATLAVEWFLRRRWGMV
ncbi:MAG TPA: glutamine amidotransferase [Gemmataceae bacterium]|nr:glutamine amidotransferase [Gemmataceae bacterium]